MPTTADAIGETIISMLGERGPGKTICPSEVARALGGSDEKVWRLLMSPIRAVAVGMADAGRVVIKRKGRVVDPHDFKGIYRIGVADPSEGDDGAGNSASVRPLAR